jgi:hypothetical protein
MGTIRGDAPGGAIPEPELPLGEEPHGAAECEASEQCGEVPGQGHQTIVFGGAAEP